MEEKIFMARVAEQAERFDDMVEFLKPILREKGGDFSVEERNLLSVGFKNLIGGKRTAIRTISAIEQNPKYQKFGAALGEYKKKIEGELQQDCQNIINMIKNDAMKTQQEAEGRAFFLKMVGDYFRYMAESATGDKLAQARDGALQHYKEAEAAGRELQACNPIKLGLALNFSVFYYEVMQDNKQACTLAETALQEAMNKIDDVDEETFRDAKSIIELLKENLTLWKEEEGGDNQIEDL
ncbi:14-3-3 protein [Stylonychia lemnae]|uniref:14-3-3 protein n=1 Tax=Stylonychia lemnae TaxID=5949 RepID=A0A078AA24_STYLE|nr:14-3-3 protein [Stylonychia lemnae]|eukprot:CDW77668.1 14-3-3 protein [Stylonychia lemnae]